MPRLVPERRLLPPLPRGRTQIRFAECILVADLGPLADHGGSQAVISMCRTVPRPCSHTLYPVENARNNQVRSDRRARRRAKVPYLSVSSSCGDVDTSKVIELLHGSPLSKTIDSQIGMLHVCIGNVPRNPKEEFHAIQRLFPKAFTTMLKPLLDIMPIRVGTIVVIDNVLGGGVDIIPGKKKDIVRNHSKGRQSCDQSLLTLLSRTCRKST